MADCSDIAPYLGDALEVDEEEAFRIHLAGCRSCQRKLEALLHKLATSGDMNKRTKK
jgi:hypothetical protein